MIFRLTVDWTVRPLDGQPLARADSILSRQDSHPHPIFDHESRSVLFTSDVRGKREIYRVPVG